MASNATAFVKRRSSVQSRLAAQGFSKDPDQNVSAESAAKTVKRTSRRTKAVQADEPESSVLRKVQEALWACGGVHVMRNNAGSRRRKFPLEPGSSDLFAIVAPYGRWLCVETKRPKNAKEEEHQLKWLDKMRRYGAVAAVVRSPDEIYPLVERARKPEVCW